MKVPISDRAAMQVVGVEIRTSNALEMSGNGRIPALWKRVRSESLLDAVPHPAEPGTILAVYSNYENREKGDYSLLIGTAVTRTDGAVPAGMVSRSIPECRVALLTSDTGPLPDVVIELWKRIWKMSPAELGADRLFTFDIERYDARATDAAHAQVEVTLSIKQGQ